MISVDRKLLTEVSRDNFLCISRCKQTWYNGRWKTSNCSHSIERSLRKIWEASMSLIFYNLHTLWLPGIWSTYLLLFISSDPGNVAFLIQHILLVPISRSLYYLSFSKAFKDMRLQHLSDEMYFQHNLKYSSCPFDRLFLSISNVFISFWKLTSQRMGTSSFCTICSGLYSHQFSLQERLNSWHIDRYWQIFKGDWMR